MLTTNVEAKTLLNLMISSDTWIQWFIHEQEKNMLARIFTAWILRLYYSQQPWDDLSYSWTMFWETRPG